MTNSLFDSLQGYIRKAERVLLVLPKKASVDAWSAMIGMKLYLESKEKEVLAVCEDEIPRQLEFLNIKNAAVKEILPDGDFIISLRTDKVDVERVKYTKEERSLDILVTPKDGQFTSKDVSFRQSVGKFDTVMGFDVPSLEHLGELFQQHPYLFSDMPLINFSIHPAYDHVGKLNLCYPGKSAISEILYEYLEYDRLEKYSHELSTVLLTGLLASTESFLNNHVNGAGFEMAAALQEKGAAQSDVIEYVFKQKSFLTLKLWGKVLQSVSLDTHYKLAWGRVVESDFDTLGGDIADLDDVARTILRFVEGVDVAMLCLEYQGKIICELRSSRESFDFSFVEALEAEVQYLDGGVDVIFRKNSLGAVEAQMLKALSEIQVKRLNVGEKPIEAFDYKVALKKKPTHNYPKTQISKISVTGSSTPEAPKEFPFEVKGVKIIKEQDLARESVADSSDQAVEVPVKKKEAGEKKVPDWLKE